ncbi:hypothetical protein N658DRAFT_526716 [Parathielavia hyrcaniae]|uniref:GYF domain-containing protein n=1 Tax=Parathielavia hyrcaniae TaxID=113614 RepID=A0AAN6PXG8_9PEZI|nr:hypothetical protein N658DRAFT_526716 [Parathielavia hyrcaniae]
MPQLTSSFASAAAGQNRDSRGPGRSDSARGSGSGDWPRSNGTRTFRRPSTTPFNQSSASPADVSHPSNSDLPPLSAHPSSASFDSPSSLRYTREELLDIYKHQVELSPIDTADLFMPTWNPAHTNGSHPRPWGKPSDSLHLPQDPSVCWAPHGTVKPISFEDLSAEERDMFSTDVNSTLKPPQPTKEGGHAGPGVVNGRKASLSIGNAATYQTSSPSTASRPGTRRRETADTNPFPVGSTASPTASRFVRDDPWMARRSTDLKEAITDEPEEDLSVREVTPARSQPFTLSRSNTAGASGFGSQSSLWGPGAAPTGGLGAFGNFALPNTGMGDKRLAGGSRLAHLIPKDSADGSNPKPSDAPSWRPRQRTDTDPFAGDDVPSGSALLGGALDDSPPSQSAQRQRGGGFDTPVKGSAGDFGMAGLHLGNQGDGNTQASPSETNPYRSPPANRADEGHGEHDAERVAQANQGSDQHSNFGTFPRSFGGAAFDGSDRSQTSSVGTKGFASVNPLSGWPAGPSVSTPNRERAPFGDAFGGALFSPLAEFPSPGIAGLGGMFGPSSSSRLGRGKLESLFPPAMQAQMHGHDQEGLGDSVPDLRQANPLGAIGRGPIGLQRDTDSPARSARGGFEDLFSATEPARSPFSTAEQTQTGLTSTTQGPSFPTTTAGGGTSFTSTQPAADPTAVRTMVMPDRMRWVYLDPQGVMQGPFSGLEMNDWYKANFFTADLRVKRLEDPDFEPLGQVIRRIGNSREPFLVPQIGVPHGPPPTTGPFGGLGSEAVPPLQSAFPSFGRTLTAQQQNELERRKQEEQMYQAQQRELAAQQQASYGRLPPIQAVAPGALHHHSSAHSLQSQPSFGSMTSPIGMTPSHTLRTMVPGAGFFDSAAAITPGPAQAPIGPAPVDMFSPELNFDERRMLANIQATGNLPVPDYPESQAIGGPVGENSGLRGQLPSIDQLRRDSEGFSERLEEFHQLRALFDADEAPAAGPSRAKQDTAQHDERVAAAENADDVAAPSSESAESTKATQDELTLTEKVLKTQADHAKSSQPPPASDLPMPFPPPVQSTQLAAPTAQRPASGLPARYGERSSSGTPDTTSDGAPLAPPPTAPWASQPGAETQKGPSLREIQEAEAKQAAKKQEVAAAARKAALEQETAALRERERAAAAAANTLLPASSTWGTGSPVGAPAGSPWKQPAALKSGVASAGPGSNGAKKTLAEIQREEEARKQKAREAAAAVAQASTPSAAAMGKRYADLAGKTSSALPGPMASAAAAQPSLGGGGWATVGAGGKVKVPTGPAVQSRAASISFKPSPSPVAAKPAPKPAPTLLKDAKSLAMDEFKKWLQRELARGLDGVADIDHFAATLLEMPLDPMILSEAVYGYSTTMDGRHFADEFVRRKRLADKGVVEKEPVGSTAPSGSGGNGGWSEVAKKGGSGSGSNGGGVNGGGSGGGGSVVPKVEESGIPGFKVVPSKKKGKK